MRAHSANGLLRVFDEAGVLEPADVHVASRLGQLARERDEAVLLATAMTVRSLRLGSVCVELDALREVAVEGLDPATLPWPEPAPLLQALRASPLVVGSVTGSLRPLRLVDSDDGPLLYLDRYHQQEQQIREALADRELTRPPVDEPLLACGLAAFGPPPDRQRIAAALAVTRWTSVVTGGPGTGKTSTVSRILALLQAQQPGLRIALAAPTGKAASRLQEQVSSAGLDLPATTLHRLLGWRPDSSTRFRHDADNLLPHDVVVLDESSMVSLTLMARLFEALRPDTRLVLVGDPDQLASVDAGAVLADLVARPSPTASDPVLERLLGADLAAPGDDEAAVSEDERVGLRRGVVRLVRGHRFQGALTELATAIRAGDADAAVRVLRAGSAGVTLVEPDDTAGVLDDVVGAARDITESAQAGKVDAALAGLEVHRLLCAHRTGPFGADAWDALARRWVLEELDGPVATGRFAVGAPLLVTANDHEARVYNGDTGVVVRLPAGLTAAFSRASGPLLRHPESLAAVSTVYAMTIHRSQGSQYRAVTVVLPGPESALLTRELLYTAVTRAQERVRVVGTEDAVRAAVGRRVLRASGLRRLPR